MGDSYFSNNTLEERFSDIRNFLPAESFTKNLSVLEVGCAEGLMSEELAKRFNYVKAIEARENAVKEAIEKYKDIKNLTFNRANIEHYQLNDYDYIFYCGVHHKLPSESQASVLIKLFNHCKDTLIIRTLPSYSEQIITMARRYTFHTFCPSYTNIGQLFICYYNNYVQE